MRAARSIPPTGRYRSGHTVLKRPSSPLTLVPGNSHGSPPQVLHCLPLPATRGNINKLRQEGMGIRAATREASLLRLRLIMMTALVACLGLLPAAPYTGIGSDTQRPFAMVIVAGLVSRTLYWLLRQSLVVRDGCP